MRAVQLCLAVFFMTGVAGGIAAVQATARPAELIQQEDYQLVVCGTADGQIEPVTGDVVPDEVAPSEAGECDGLIDVGFGIKIGFTFGLKVRGLATLGPGLVLGVDLDAGTSIFLSEATASVILGWSFDVGSHVIRPYAAVGGGVGYYLIIPNIFYEGPVVRVVLPGVEWKPRRRFGSGLELGLIFWPGEGLVGPSGGWYLTRYF